MARADELIATLLDEARRERLQAHETAEAILAADLATRAAVAVAAIERLGTSPGLVRNLLGLGVRSFYETHALQDIVGRLTRANVGWSEPQACAVLAALPRAIAGNLPPLGPFRAVERTIAAQGLGRTLADALAVFRETLDPRYPNDRKMIVRIDALLGHEDDAGDDPWSRLARHAMGEAGKARPSAKWRARAAELVAEIGEAAFVEQLAARLGEVRFGPAGLPDPDRDALKGFVWAAAALDDAGLAHAIAAFAERCFRKIPGFGAGSSSLGNACIFALGEMPGGVGVAHLSRLGGKVRYAAGRRALERTLDGAAARAGQTREDLEELAVPTLGLEADGAKLVPVGEHAAELAIVGVRSELRWLRPGGKPQASVPVAIKTTHAAQVKALKKEQAQLDALLEAQVSRIARLWTGDRRLPVAALRARYLAHPLVGPIARRLLWRIDGPRGPVDAMWHAGALAGVAGAPLDVPDDAEARLWHLLDCDDVDRLLVWRDLLEERAIRQPFPQLWRTVYRARDPDAHADPRFDNHILRQQGLLTMCKQRGWQYTIQGHWDSYNTPTLQLPRWNLEARLEVNPLDHARDAHIFQYVLLGSLEFRRPDEPGVLALGDVPPLVFSEVMRDVDLFVGATTVANDATFDEAGLRAESRRWWEEAVFGPLGEAAVTRREILARTLPRTTLRGRARVEERWLIIEGREELRVHLGTGQVRRGDDARPVAITPDRAARERAAAVFLPFEGDSVLANILARAYLLAEED